MAKKIVKHANAEVAFLAAQRSVKDIVKTRFDGDRDSAAFSGSTIDVVLDVIVPALNAEGCSFRQPTRFVTYADKGVSVVDTIITHAETGTAIRDDGWPVLAGILPSKDAGGRLTYARKQAALSIMGIAPRGDDAHAAAADGASPAPSVATSGDHLIVIDGASLMYRAFHGCPTLTRDSDGAHVGGVVGFVGIMGRLLERCRRELNGSHLVVVFDAGRTTFRNTMSPEYKAHRPPMAPEFASQIPLMQDAVAAMGAAWVSLKGFEADDIVATYARAASDTGAMVTVVSADKDSLQLMALKRVRVFEPVNLSQLGREDCIEKHGVAPELVCDAQALIGDVADNVQGAPGIGPVNAGKLLDRFGSLEGILARIDELDATSRAAIEPIAAQLMLSKQLVTLRSDVPTPMPWHGFPLTDCDQQALDTFVADLGPHAPVVPKVFPPLPLPRDDEGPSNPKLCAELLLRLTRAKKLAVLPEWEADFNERKAQLSEAQIATLEGAHREKRAALGGAAPALAGSA